MKANLQQALTGKSLRNNIFDIFHNKSLHSFSTFLRRSRQRQSRYLPYSSQHTLIRSEIQSPIRGEISANQFSPQSQLQGRSQEKSYSPFEKSKGIYIQRIKGKKITSSKSKKRSGNKSSSSRDIPRKRHNNSGKKSKSKELSSRIKIQSRGKSKDSSKSKKSKGSSSKDKKRKQKSNQHPQHPDSKINLSSIMEQQSSEEKMNTPSSKIGTKRDLPRRSAIHIQKTHKKQKSDILSELICKRIEKMSKQPSKFLRIFKNEDLIIRYKLQRRKILELEVITIKNLATLTIRLQPGNLQCQHIEERYEKLSSNERISLFTCVRDVNLQQAFRLPKVRLEVLGQGEEAYQKIATIPYTWVHFSGDSKIKSTKSRVITKTCLQGINVDLIFLRSLSYILPNWSTKYWKNQTKFSSHFSINENSFEILISQQRGIWTLELSGRGQQRLEKMISFIYEFLC